MTCFRTSVVASATANAVAGTALAMRLRLPVAAALAFGVLALTACGNDSPDGAAAGVPADVCVAVEKLDPAGVLGGPPERHRECSPNESLATLGAAVWTAAGGRRVSVSVIDNTKPREGLGTGTFQQLYDQAPAAQRCTLPETGGGQLRCVDKLSTGQTETGTIIIDLGATYLTVWLSEEDDRSAGIDLSADLRPAFLAFVVQAVKTIYGTDVEIPAALAQAGPAPAGSTALDTQTSAPPTGSGAGDGLAAQLTQAGYMRTMTGGYHSPELGRKVSIEDWKADSDPSRPVVALSDARTEPGKLAIAEVQYEAFGTYREFSCIPHTKYAFDLRWVLDQSNTIRQQVAQGTVQPKPAPNNRQMVDNADRSLTCYME